ncbi:hypothetical protein F7731_02555 [Cytobacillus depressus]|uniref:Uncharacterized protein n=1 Tax=Cytobacillus depressus TaxID=1602942 RepID=A0A6L3VB91_9BACI|nr:hypothetical protein F7731_02555 [Cytobacillus depressus]
MKLHSVGCFSQLNVSCGPQDVGHADVATGRGALSLRTLNRAFTGCWISRSGSFCLPILLKRESYSPLICDKWG